jgi:replicative DNA helicase
MLIDDTAGLSINELRAKSRRLMDKHGLGLIVIDYLQLLKSPSKRGQENRQIEIAEISGGIKALAKELKIPIIVLAQLNRKSEDRGDGKPRISDLRESGSIEQDADVVGLLYRSAYYAKDDEEKSEKGGEAELIIAKQRNGPTGEVPLTFLSEFTRFETRDMTHGEGS